MSNVPERPSGANNAHPSVPRTDLADPAARAEWLSGACEQAADLIAAARDATADPAARILGRCAAREHIEEAAHSLTSLFASVGLDLTCPPVALRDRLRRALAPREAAAPASAGHSDGGPESVTEVAALGTAALSFACAHSDSDRDDVLQEMPLAGVLFLAMTGCRGERAEVDPPLLQALCALRDTAEGWIEALGYGKGRASIARVDLDLFVRRIEATIEIARRAGMGGAP